MPLRPSALSILFISIAFAVSGCTAPQPALKSSAKATYTYTVDATAPASHKFKLTLRASGLSLPPGEATFYLPAWAPGAYQFTQFGRYADSLAAFAGDGSRLTVRRENFSTWKISSVEKLERIEYLVGEIIRPELLWPETTELNLSRGYFNGTNVFGYFAGVKDATCKVSYKLPAGWRVASGVEVAPNSVEAVASDYDELVDAPVIMGKFNRYDFTVQNKPHSVVIDADSLMGVYSGAFKPDSLIAITKEIVAAQARLFGELPYQKYLFIHRLARPKIFGAFGALEHRNSSAYYMPLFDGHKVRDNQMTNVVSHEFFHLWNPKRIHTSLLGPFDYQSPVQTRTVWFAEGITDYYADLLLLKAGIISEENFLAAVLQRIKLINGLPNSYSEGLESLSLRLASAEDPNEITPFYYKGTMLAMLLDIELRSRTANRFGTDELVQALNERFGKGGKTFEDTELPKLITEISGVDISLFHRRFIAGKETFPFEEQLKKAGLLYAKRREDTPFLGAFILPDSNDVYSVATVVPNSTADKMGLRENDEVLRFNNVTPLEQEEFLRFLLNTAKWKTGDAVTIVVRRNKKEVTLTGKLGSRRIETETLAPNLDATPEERAILKRMLHQFNR
ncbi:MAG: M61 family metallopeptidase [Rhizobacter sp.]|nr:M61 family metallopeptidase [Chlorobiales bacterium]